VTLSGVRCVTRQSSVERLADLDQKLSEYREVVLSHVVDVPVVDLVAVLVGECVPETGSLSHPGGDIVGQDSRLAKRPEDGGVRLREFAVASFEYRPMSRQASMAVWNSRSTTSRASRRRRTLRTKASPAFR